MLYRGYKIRKLDRGYVATPADGDRLEIHSAQESRLRHVINSFWYAASLVHRPGSAIEEMAMPRLIREWLQNPTDVIDVDAAYARGAC